MFVLAQVSSMKTSRPGSIRAWYVFHCRRRLATSGRSCSLASAVFFEAQSFAMHEGPHRPIADPNATLGQLLLQSPQRQLRLLGDAGVDKVTMGFKQNRLVSTHLCRRDAARLAQAPDPFDHRAHANAKMGRCTSP
jgi:hypothetical protein